MITTLILLMQSIGDRKEIKQAIQLQLYLLRSPLGNYRMLRSNDTKVRAMTDKVGVFVPSLGQAILQLFLL